MSNDWKNTKEEKPPQGQKVLCCDHGDFYVAQRFGDYWFQIPFVDSQASTIDPPELWSYINFPRDFKGKVKIVCKGKLMDIDQFEKESPKDFNDLVKSQYEYFMKFKSRRDEFRK